MDMIYADRTAVEQSIQGTRLGLQKSRVLMGHHIQHTLKMHMVAVSHSNTFQVMKVPGFLSQRLVLTKELQTRQLYSIAIHPDQLAVKVFMLPVRDLAPGEPIHQAYFHPRTIHCLYQMKL